MKKVFLSFAAVLLFALPISCTETPTTQQLPQTDRPFSSTVEISYGDFSAEADLTYRNSAGAVLEIIAPQNLEGLIFNFNGETLNAEYKGISYPLSDTNGQAVSAARLIFSAIANAATSKDTKIDTQTNEFSVSGSVSSLEYEMRFDKTSGAIKSFSVPEQNLKATFTNFKFLG